jgi:hypothetical protein
MMIGALQMAQMLMMSLRLLRMPSHQMISQIVEEGGRVPSDTAVALWSHPAGNVVQLFGPWIVLRRATGSVKALCPTHPLETQLLEVI